MHRHLHAIEHVPVLPPSLTAMLLNFHAIHSGEMVEDYTASIT